MLVSSGLLMPKNKNRIPLKPTIRIAILEDNQTLALALKIELDQPKFKVCSVDDDINQFIENINHYLPNVAIVDIRIWGNSIAGLEAIKKIGEVSPNTKVMVYSAYDNFEMLSQAIKLNVKAFVIKSISEKPLVEIINLVTSGKLYFGTYTHVVDTFLQRSVEEKGIV